jgi:hypothetical protein
VIVVAAVLASNAKWLTGWAARDKTGSLVLAPVNVSDVKSLYRPIHYVMHLRIYVVLDRRNRARIPFDHSLVRETGFRESEREASAAGKQLDTTQTQLNGFHPRPPSAWVAFWDRRSKPQFLSRIERVL